jgi:hypothetical protein
MSIHDLLKSDVYKAANDLNVTVVGGGSRSVGAAGGWVQGGGHSPLSGLYGLGVDSESKVAGFLSGCLLYIFRCITVYCGDSRR